ncbi:MAG: hypothetical protein ACKPKO_49750, partial [Candidatus Fonsibacter sp.]
EKWISWRIGPVTVILYDGLRCSKPGARKSRTVLYVANVRNNASNGHGPHDDLAYDLQYGGSFWRS